MGHVVAGASSLVQPNQELNHELNPELIHEQVQGLNQCPNHYLKLVPDTIPRTKPITKLTLPNPPSPQPHTPQTLHPAPYTVHPTPYTLPPTPYTLHPTPYTLTSNPELNPKT